MFMTRTSRPAGIPFIDWMFLKTCSAGSFSRPAIRARTAFMIRSFASWCGFTIGPEGRGAAVAAGWPGGAGAGVAATDGAAAGAGSGGGAVPHPRVITSIRTPVRLIVSSLIVAGDW